MRRLKKPTVIVFQLTVYGHVVAPSSDLRKWFGHVPERFPEFTKRYKAELAESGALDDLHKVLSEHPDATLLFAAHDEEHNNAVVLKELLS